MKSFSKAEALKFGWNTFTQNASFLISVFLVIFFLNFLPELLLSFVESFANDLVVIASMIILLIFTVAVSIYIGVGIINVSLKFVDKKKVGWSDLIAKSNRIWPYIVVSFIYALFVTIGLIALIIPGIYIAVTFYFSHYLVIDKNMEPVEAIKKSGRLMKGHKWNFLVFSLILGLINVVAGLPLFFVTDDTHILAEMLLTSGMLISMPFTYLSTAYVYRKLEKKG